MNRPPSRWPSDSIIRNGIPYPHECIVSTTCPCEQCLVCSWPEQCCGYCSARSVELAARELGEGIGVIFARELARRPRVYAFVRFMPEPD